MLKDVIFKEHNLHIINFYYVFKTQVEKDLIDELHKFELLGDTCSTTIRRLFLHHNIYKLCEYLLKCNSREKIIIYFDQNNIYDSELAKYLTEEKVKKYLELVFRKMKNILPLRIYFSTFSLDYLNNRKREGIGIETINKIKNMLYKHDFNKFTFERCKKFVKKEGLYFLDKHYFNNLKSKQLLLV